MNTFFSTKTLDLINKIEFLVIFLIAYSRFKLFQLEKEIEELDYFICLVDVEDGWSFILLAILFALNIILLFQKKHPIFWCLKLIIFLSLLMIISSNYWLVFTMLLVLTLFYLLNPVSKEFNVYGKKKIGYIFIILIGTFISLYLETLVDLTHYY